MYLFGPYQVVGHIPASAVGLVGHTRQQGEGTMTAPTLADIEDQLAEISVLNGILREMSRQRALMRGELPQPDPTHEENVARLLALRVENNRVERNLKRRMRNAERRAQQA